MSDRPRRRSPGAATVAGAAGGASLLLLSLTVGRCGWAEPPPAAPVVRFTDAAEAAGLARDGPSFAAAAADFDRDGWPDLAVSAHGAVEIFSNVAGAFRDVSAASGVVREDTHGVSWIDLDRDGWLDLLVSVGADRGYGRGDNQIYRNRRGGSMALDGEVPEVLRDPLGRGRCSVAVDLDLDGVLDVLAMNAIQEGRWHRLARAAADGGWAAADATSGVTRLDAECLTAVHLDRTGAPTLFAYGSGAADGRAFRPGPDGALADVTAELGIVSAWSTVYAVAPGDYDGDGDLDLYFVRGHDVPPTLVRRDDGLDFRLVALERATAPSFRFRCPGRFRLDALVGSGRRAAAIHLGARRAHPRRVPWDVAPDDPTLDGAPADDPAGPLGLYVWRAAPDEYTVALVGDGQAVRGASGTVRGGNCPFEVLEASAELTRPPRPTPNLLLRNVGGRFEDATLAAGVGDPGSGRDAVFFDADDDGDLDLFVVNGGSAFAQEPDVLYLNRGDGTFADGTAEAGVAGPERGRGASVTALDYDRDGDVDLFVTNGDGPPLGNVGPYSLWRNDTAPRGGWIEADLAGGAGNPAALGATVVARFGGRRLAAERTSTSGRFSTTVLPFHFGLGAADEAKLEVRWPSGATTRATVRRGERVVVREPAAPPRPGPGRPK